MIWNAFPTVQGEPADLVLGQPDFGVTNTAPPSASSMLAPSGVWSDGTRFFVADSGHNRVLIWNTFPISNGQPADVVVGQPGFDTSGSGLSPTSLFNPVGVTSNADALFIGDLVNDRVLVFAPIPVTNGASATFVLGQPALDAGANNPPPTAMSIDRPRQISLVGTRLWVADEGHNRLLRFSLYPP